MRVHTHKMVVHFSVFAKKRKERKRKDVEEMMIAIVSEPSEEIQLKKTRENGRCEKTQKVLLIARSVGNKLKTHMKDY